LQILLERRYSVHPGSYVSLECSKVTTQLENTVRKLR